MREGREYLLREVLTYSVMVAMQFSTVGINTLLKAATMEGMSPYVFVSYSYGFASLLLLFPTFFFHRSLSRAADDPPLTIPLLWRICLLVLTGSLSRVAGYVGVYYSSPTLSSAIGNLFPAFTFILALMFGMEKVVMGRRSSQAKILGIVVSMAGAFVITLYKGPPIFVALLRSSRLGHSLVHPTAQFQSWILGGSLITLQYVLSSLWSILMTQIMGDYPLQLTVIFIYNTFVSIVCAVVALVAEGTSSDAWIMRSNIALAAVFCAGVFGSCLSVAAQAWILPIKGPVFAHMFTPLAMVIAVAMDVTLLGDALHLGSLVGASVIAIGFYMFMWGKAKDQTDDHSSSTNAEKVPLL